MNMTETEKASVTEWNEAMNWWKNQNETVQRLIRHVANKRLIARGAEEIGSSDTNCGVFDLYQEYKVSGSPEVIPFLVDYSNEY